MDPPLRHHLFDLILKQQKQGLYIHSKDPIKICLRLIGEQPIITGDSSIIECVIEPSERFESEWYDPFHLIGLAEVGLDEGRRSALVPDVID